MSDLGPAHTYVTSRGRVVTWRERISSRARCAKITVSPHGDGVVIVQPRFGRVDPVWLLRSNEAWLERTLAKLAPMQSAHKATSGLPATIEFKVSDERWRVDYHATNAKGVSMRADPGLGVVRLSGAVADEDKCRTALRRFVSTRAKDVLPALLEHVSRDCGIAYRSCRVSNARSRWGSCSSTGDIMLSTCLMFLPQPLAVHVAQHELAHIVHPNHSARFHALLDQLDPAARKNAKTLKLAGALVPGWMD